MVRFKRKDTLTLVGAYAICLVAAYTILEKPQQVITCVATAYAIEGTTASGEETRKGIVAVDPSVIPMGSILRITGAGKYSGVYRAADTGANIIGSRIDIYMESWEAAKKFGRREVRVAILRFGDDTS